MILCFSSLSLSLLADVATPAPTESPSAEAVAPDIHKISEAFGHLIGKNMEHIGVALDLPLVIKGLEEASAGKVSPMTEAECVQAISAIQERLFHEQSDQNLAKAVAFLANNSKNAHVVSLEEGKVQFKIEKAGSGQVVEAHFSPIVRYSGKYLDGTVFHTSEEGEALPLDDLIPGLRTGLIGMHEGEKRTVHIHPDLAFGTRGHQQPNALLTFEVEVLQANAPTPPEVKEGTEISPSHEIAEEAVQVR